MNFSKKAISLAGILLIVVQSLPAQVRQTREEYIDRYKSIAVAHMERYGIPASITMAQGILESDCGNSWLSLQSNNYEQGSINHYGVAQLNSEWSDSFSTQVRVSYNDYKRMQVPYGGRDFGQFQVCLDPTAVGSLTGCTANVGRIQFGPDASRQANELYVQTLGLEFQGRIQGNGHDVKLIAEYKDQNINNLFAQNVSGVWYFDSVADLQAQRANQLVYSTPTSGNIDGARALFDNNMLTFGIQDTYDLTPDITVIAGVRYDLYMTSDRPQFNQAFVDRYGFANTSTLSGRDLVQPRFGITWNAADRLRLRGTAGLYGGGNPNVWISNNYSNPGPTLAGTTSTVSDRGRTSSGL